MGVVNWNGNIVDIVDIIDIIDNVDMYLPSPGWVWLICAGALKAAEGAV